MKIRLIWRKGLSDADGKFCEYEYQTDVIELPDDSHAFQFPDTKSHGWLPELIGGEWIRKEAINERTTSL